MSSLILIVAVVADVLAIVFLFSFSCYIWLKEYYDQSRFPTKAILSVTLGMFLFVGTFVFAHDYKAENDAIQAQNNANMATVLIENGIAPENVSAVLSSMSEIYD